ncbi:Proline-rich receptor-like protein kinase PERK1 [Linum grandiflorum]
MSSPAPPTNSTAPPPATPSAPPPATPSTPPPATPSAPPPATPSTPPPATPSAPPPATPSPPPPATPAAAPPPATPATPAAPPPSSSSSPPPPRTPSTPAPASSPPPPSSSSPSPPTSSSPPPTPPSNTPSPPSNTPSPPSNTPSPPSNTPSPPSTTTPPSSRNPVTPSPPSGGGGHRSPPSSARSPPPPSGGSPPNSSSSSSSSGLSTGVVVGIAIGGVAILLLLSLLCLCCKKKRRRGDHEAAYYAPPPPSHKVDHYGIQQQQHWQQVAPPPPDHMVATMPKLQPSPLGSMPAPPPPPPGYMSSSGASNYSESETPLPPPSPGIAMSFSKSTFTYEELARATDGFSDANLLGQGGFGYVHRGVLPNGKEVAIKQLKVGSGQGEREFQAEVEIISRVHHKHLVSLVGYCTTGSERLLVYEFVTNNTLEFHLHGKGRPTMEWPARLRIALGSAKGLAYLHEDCHPKIIHRDIKAANILLDFKFEAKVADFGLAKFTSDLNTHVSTRVMGTFGYLAPEYASSGKLSEKSDVFSFGVMLLELITGRRPVDTTHTYMDDSLVDWARPILSRALEDGCYDALVDRNLQDNFDINEMARMVACAAACVRHSARRRPRMSQVVRALEGDVSLVDLNEGIKPGHSRMYGGSYGESSDYDTSQYNDDMKKFRKVALGSQEYGAGSEYSGPATSDYGLYPSGSSSEGQTTREMEMRKVKRNSQGFNGSTLRE